MNTLGDAIVCMSVEQYRALRDHLLPQQMRVEEAAFLFAQIVDDGRAFRFNVIDWYPVPAEGFDAQSGYYLELTNETRAFVIKRAHDLGCCLIEAHSHLSYSPAAFSPSDRYGFDDFVPHVLWRLKERPYAAIVMTTDSFDALVWRRHNEPIQVASLTLDDGDVILPTRLTLSKDYDDVGG